MKEKLTITNKNKPLYILAIASILYVIAFTLIIGLFLFSDDFFLFKIFKRHALIFFSYVFYFFANELADFYTLEIDYQSQSVSVTRTRLIFKKIVRYSDSLPEYISLNGNLVSYNLKIWLSGNKHLQFSKGYEYDKVLELAKRMAKLLEVDIYVNIDSNDKYWIENNEL